jgi:ribonuclease-3
VKERLDFLYEKLGYQFKNSQLLEAALTHRSLRGENNERLEFLGDSILNFIIAEEVYRRLPNAREGDLSRLRSSLVKGETLAEMASEFALGNYLRLGTGELKSGGQSRTSILADTMEALMAAIYLDSDILVCKQLVLHWYQSRLTDLNIEDSLKDPKTRLQEYMQSHHLPLPIYRVIETSGEAHAQLFVVECTIEALKKSSTGTARNRRKAEQDAAEHLLGQLVE